MYKYANLSGRSGVDRYLSQRGSLTVRFNDGSEYVYTNSSAGRYQMRRMRQLADRGVGLNGYINTTVKTGYASKSLPQGSASRTRKRSKSM